jgi:hypothetical protein
VPTDSGLTELIDIDASRIDLVKNPANGFPILLMKAVNAQGGIDEKPDIAGAEHVLQLLATLIQSEAAEMAVGKFDEIEDIELLSRAACMMQCFLRLERYGDEDDGESLYKDLPAKDELEQVVTYLSKRKVSAAERRRLAESGHALPDGSYPVENEEDLHNAAILARSGHGDVAAAKRLIAKRAKELGVANPLANDMSKDGEMPEAKQDNTETSPAQEAPEVTPDTPVEKSIAELVQEEVAKAVQPLDERNKALEAEMALLKSTPIPGGPMVTVPGSQRTDAQRASHLAEAQRYDSLAKSISGNQELTRYYEEKAAEARQAAKA